MVLFSEYAAQSNLNCTMSKPAARCHAITMYTNLLLFFKIIELYTVHLLSFQQFPRTKGRSGRIAHLTFRRTKKILNTKESVRN